LIRFGAILSVVLVAIALLAAGAVSGSLLLVYLAIGVAALALVLLIAGVVIWREEVFGGAVATGQDGQRDLATGKPDRGAVSSPEQDAACCVRREPGTRGRPVRREPGPGLRIRADGHRGGRHCEVGCCGEVGRAPHWCPGRLIAAIRCAGRGRSGRPEFGRRR